MGILSSPFLLKRRPLQRCVSMLQTDMRWFAHTYQILTDRNFAYEKFGVLFKTTFLPFPLRAW